MKLKKTSALSLVAAALATPLAAHEGEDHGAPAAVERHADEAPRAAATTEAFELVAVLGGAGLVVYLDRFETNAPVAGARVEVESGSFKAEAKETSPGVYATAAPALQSPGSHALTISVDAGDTADLIGATLEVAARASPVERSPAAADRSVGRLAALGGIGVVAVGAAAWIAARVRRRGARSPGDVHA